MKWLTSGWGLKLQQYSSQGIILLAGFTSSWLVIIQFLETQFNPKLIGVITLILLAATLISSKLPQKHIMTIDLRRYDVVLRAKDE